MTPRVSVCVATYNHAPYIQDCLMSVVAQAEDVPLEILVGVDQCEDGTGDIVQGLADKFPGIIRCFQHPERIGGTRNYQVLIQEALGEYIAHLDGDDFWLPGKLREQVRVLDQLPAAPAVYSNALVLDDRGKARGLFNNPLPESFDLNALLRKGNFLNHSSMVYRASLRHLILAVEGPLLDYRIHLRLVRHGTLAYVNRPLLVYRQASSSSTVLNANDFVRDLYWETLLEVPKEAANPRDLGRSMAEFLRSVLFRSLRLGSGTLIRQWWPKVFAVAPLTPAEMAFWVLYATLRTGMQEVLGRACAHLGGSGMRVSYPR